MGELSSFYLDGSPWTVRMGWSKHVQLVALYGLKNWMNLASGFKKLAEGLVSKMHC
jgi:hypothetical protein